MLNHIFFLEETGQDLEWPLLLQTHIKEQEETNKHEASYARGHQPRPPIQLVNRAWASIAPP
jgi:hypothetical protein